MWQCHRRSAPRPTSSICCRERWTCSSCRRSPRWARQHGYGLARRIEQLSGDEVLLNQGTIYASLVRLQQRRWITAEWGVSETNRRAKDYSITKAGTRELAEETLVLGAPDRGCRPCARAIGQEREVTGRLREIWARLAGFVRGRQPDRDLDEELAAHAELAADDYVRRGIESGRGAAPGIDEAWQPARCSRTGRRSTQPAVDGIVDRRCALRRPHDAEESRASRRRQWPCSPPASGSTSSSSR